MQRRIAKKNELEFILEKTMSHPSPKAYLEQYTIPADLAGWILRQAAYSHDDIVGKTVLDLGCGTGRLAIGAAILGAENIIGIDIDHVAVATARRNVEEAGVGEKIAWIVGDIDSITGHCDTVLQNPPFGVQRRGADARFLEKALKVADITYSLHKSGKNSMRFISDLVKTLGGEITEILLAKFEIPHTFEFHRRRRYTIIVDLYRIKRR
jgi:putative methylase